MSSPSNSRLKTSAHQNPSFLKKRGQSFISTSLDKLSRLRGMIDVRGLDVHIEVDGGIDLSNVAEVVRHGARWLVSGAAVFGKSDPEEATLHLRLKALETLTV